MACVHTTGVLAQKNKCSSDNNRDVAGCNRRHHVEAVRPACYGRRTEAMKIIKPAARQKGGGNRGREFAQHSGRGAQHAPTRTRKRWKPQQQVNMPR